MRLLTVSSAHLGAPIAALCVVLAVLTAPTVAHAQRRGRVGPSSSGAGSTSASTQAGASASGAASGAPAPDTIAGQLAAIRELILHASYRQALPEVRRYLDRADLDASQRNIGLELQATIHLALRDEVSARQAFQQLLSRDPEHRLSDPDASPVVLSAFARARAQARPVTVTMAHDPPLLTRRRAPLISVRLEEGADAVSEIRMHHRVRGSPDVGTVVMRIGQLATAEGRLPLAADDNAYTAEYWLEAVAPSGYVLARRGTEAQPIAVAVPQQTTETRIVEVAVPGGGQAESNDVTEEPWFWVVVGVVVLGGAGAGIGIAIATSGPDSGSLGNIALPLAEF
ncbi:MAG: hypothetical protein OHK0013_02630 [Sandaracinaceae bacterium]